MENLQKIAFFVIGRGVGFGILAIFCISVSFAFDLRLAVKSGAIMTTILTLILVFRASTALSKPLRKTEMWIYLEKESRLPDAYAQRVGAGVLRETYLWFAYRAAIAATALWVAALVAAFVV